MSKKIKILLTSVIVMLLTIISTNVMAWSGNSPTPGQVMPQTDDSYVYFCREKNGPLRYTPGVYNSGDFEDITIDLSNPNSQWSRDYGTWKEEFLIQHESDVATILTNHVNDIKNKIGAEAQPRPLPSNSYLIDYNGSDWNVEDDKGTIAYTPVYYDVSSRTHQNDEVSYIFTAGKEGSPEVQGFKTGNRTASVSDRMNINDFTIKQQALWHTRSFNEGAYYNPTLQAAYDLYNESVEYNNYYNQTLKNNNYKNQISLDESRAKVIVNQTSGKYILGPYSLSYPSYLKFSYVENIQIKTNHSNADRSIINPTSIYTKDSTSRYPNPGEDFFVEFDASDLDGATKAGIKVFFTYLDNTSATYIEIAGSGDIYVLKSDYTRKFDRTDRQTKWVDTSIPVNNCPNDPNFRVHVDAFGNEIVQRLVVTTSDYYNLTYRIYLEQYGYYRAQKLIKILHLHLDSEGRGASIIKQWKGESLESHQLDLTIELGGLVWEEDITKGKANGKADGEFNLDERIMSNVLVKLYDSNGRYIDSTVTSATVIRSNPKYNYVFTGLDPMKKYYVEFTYNGQYYEPTYYKYSDTANWATTSKGADIRLKRTNYNEQFKTIYDYTNNYTINGKSNETFTREDLIGHVLKVVDGEGKYVSSDSTYAVIDEFGNLLYDIHGNEGARKSNQENGEIVPIDRLNISKEEKDELQKKIQFVKDCQTQSYSLNPGDSNNYSPNNSGLPNKPDLYPVLDKFVIGVSGVNSTIGYISSMNTPLYVFEGGAYSNYCINQGYVVRQKVDLALQEEPLDVTTEINGVSHTYPYGKLDIDNDGVADITVRLSDHYYDVTNYTRTIRVEDYLYNVDNITDVNGKRLNELGKSKSDELEVYVRYVVYVQNKSTGGIRTRLDEVVNYYDNDYIFVPERSCGKIWSNITRKYSSAYALNIRGMQEGTAYNTDKAIDGYNNLYIKTLKDNDGKDIYLEEGDIACLYLTFKVGKDENGRIKLDETLNGTQIGVGKENISEVNGYTTKYKDGTEIPNAGTISGNDTTAGLIDINSNPGNLSKYLDIKKDQENTDFTKFENDTDKAPSLRIILDRDDSYVRTISGVVREDDRTNSNGVTSIGDGVLGNNEQLIDGVTVQLVEIAPVRDENGKVVFEPNGEAKFQEIIWKEVSSGSADATPMINENNLVKDYDFEGNTKGAYAFKSFVPGKYIVRFVYGNTTKTVLTNVEGSAVNTAYGDKGLNEKSYNGQDYKSTVYQKDVNTAKSYIWRDESIWNNGVETLGRELRTISAFNKETANQNDTLEYLYDMVASDQYSDISDAKDIAGRRAEVNAYSSDIKNHIAEVLESYEKMPQDSSANVKAFVDELIAKTYMIAETGLIPVDFEYDGVAEGRYAIKDLNLGLQERPKAQLAVNKDITNVKVTLADGSILFDAKDSATNVLWRKPKATNFNNLYSDNKLKQNEIEAMRNANAYGLVQLTMDQEIMHGATLEITYAVTVTNVGEVDYNDNKFYYTGVVGNSNSVVKTSAEKVIDYVANNLQFDKSRNSEWDVISKDTLVTDDVNTTLVNKSLKDNVSKYNTVIVTKSLNKDLVPTIYKKLEAGSENSVTVPLVLTQVITSENKSDDLTYNNTVEIVETSNIVGRKNAYSIVGNQDSTVDPQEVDADKAEQVKILPPFGNGGMNYIIAITLVSAVAILVGGIIFIRKKVLKK